MEKGSVESSGAGDSVTACTRLDLTMQSSPIWLTVMTRKVSVLTIGAWVSLLTSTQAGRFVLSG